jgi:hypothetical protein
MKKVIYATFIVLMLGVAFAPTSVFAWANGEAPWGAPVMPNGTQISKDSTSLVLEYNETHDQILDFYNKALKSYPDSKNREWKDQTYIEDQGGANWHSIGISKGTGKTTVKITRDNMTWIMSTLLIRFAGVFLVLCILWTFLNINSFCMKRFFPEKKKA